MVSVHDEYAKCEKCQKSGGVRYYNCNTRESSFECPFCHWFYEYVVFRFGRNHFDELRRITKGEPSESKWRDADCVLEQLLAECDENGQTEKAEEVRTMLSRATDEGCSLRGMKPMTTLAPRWWPAHRRVAGRKPHHEEFYVRSCSGACLRVAVRSNGERMRRVLLA